MLQSIQLAACTRFVTKHMIGYLNKAFYKAYNWLLVLQGFTLPEQGQQNTSFERNKWAGGTEYIVENHCLNGSRNLIYIKSDGETLICELLFSCFAVQEFEMYTRFDILNKLPNHTKKLEHIAFMYVRSLQQLIYIAMIRSKRRKKKCTMICLHELSNGHA